MHHFFFQLTHYPKEVLVAAQLFLTHKRALPHYNFYRAKSNINEGRKIRNFMNLKTYESEGLGTDNTNRQTDS